MLELFLSSLEDQLGLIVDPPLAPIARMGIISEEITRITSSGLTPRIPDDGVRVVSRKKTSRGFAVREFIDLYGAKCSIQKSSLATDDAIWLGVDNADPKIMASQAKSFGITTEETTGWVSYPVPYEVQLTTRMHLNRKQVAELLPILQKFVDTGEI